MSAILDHRDARAAASVHGHDDCVLDARCLQRLNGTRRGGLVDGIDSIDVLVLGQAALHPGLALILSTLARLVADDLVVAAFAPGVLARS